MIAIIGPREDEKTDTYSLGHFVAGFVWLLYPVLIHMISLSTR